MSPEDTLASAPVFCHHKPYTKIMWVKVCLKLFLFYFCSRYHLCSLGWMLGFTNTNLCLDNLLYFQHHFSTNWNTVEEKVLFEVSAEKENRYHWPDKVFSMKGSLWAFFLKCTSFEWNTNIPSPHWPVKHDIYPLQLPERMNKVILTVEFNLDAEVHAIPVSGKRLWEKPSFWGSSKHLPWHITRVITTEQKGEPEAAAAAHRQGYNIQADLWTSTSMQALCKFSLRVREHIWPSTLLTARALTHHIPERWLQTCSKHHVTLLLTLVLAWIYLQSPHPPPQHSPACFSGAESLPWCRDPGHWYSLSQSAGVLRWFSPSWPSCVAWLPLLLLLLCPPAAGWQGLRTLPVEPFFLVKKGKDLWGVS